MKKYFSGLVAVVFAILATAFTTPKQNSTLDPAFDWEVFDASGTSTGTFILNKTKAVMQSDYPNCNANTTTCFREWNLGHSVATNTYLKKS